MSHNIFYIADLHFGHDNAITYDNRPWSTVDEMDREMIRLWNSRITNNDTVYILGDFSMKLTVEEAVAIANKLNGKKHLIRGNHDFRKPEFEAAFDSVQDYLEIADTVSLDGIADKTTVRVVMSHYFMPFYNKNRRNCFMLYGHSHMSKETELEEMIKTTLREMGQRCEAYNVGTMHLDYIPKTLEEIIRLQTHEVNFPAK